MIPKSLDEIEWADLLQLRDSGREEGPNLEFKSSFKGGNDFLGFNDQKKANAVDAIAREVIAFLNSVGGDLVIGAEEISNEQPRIADFCPLPNAQAVADRLAQSLSAIIEPTQSLVNVRAICEGDGDEGVLIVRVGSSLRAPHRSSRTREAFARRGRESVPMPMDEIQDMTLSRSRLRNERYELLEKQFLDLNGTRIGRSTLPDQRFHIRAAMIPLSELQIELDQQTLLAANPNDHELVQQGQRQRFNVAFRDLHANWRPVLRGKRIESHTRRAFHEDDFTYVAREIRENGIFVNEFGCLAHIGQEQNLRGLHFAWLVGFVANVLQAAGGLVNLHPELSDSVIRFGIYCCEGIEVEMGMGRFFEDRYDWPEGAVYLPDFQTPRAEDLNAMFSQIQADLCAVIGVDSPHPFQFHVEE